MRIKSLLFLVTIFSFFFFYAGQADAACQATMDPNTYEPVANTNPRISATLTATGCFENKLGTDLRILTVPGTEGNIGNDVISITAKPNTADTIKFQWSANDGAMAIENPGEWRVIVCELPSGQSLYDQQNGCNTPQNILAVANVTITTEKLASIASDVPKVIKEDQVACAVESGTEITFTATNISPDRAYEWFYPGECLGGPCSKDTCQPDGATVNKRGDGSNTCTRSSDGTSLTFTLRAEDTQNRSGKQRVCIDIENGTAQGQNCIEFLIKPQIADGEDVSCKTISSENGLNAEPTLSAPHPPCPDKYISYSEYGSDSQRVFVGCGMLNTGLGVEFSTNPTEFISSVFTMLLSISGAILLILIIFSGYQMMTSQGDAEKIKAARERITSAIVGFVFLIFSMVILEVIGVDILRIPGFCREGDSSCEQIAPPATPESSDVTSPNVVSPDDESPSSARSLVPTRVGGNPTAQPLPTNVPNCGTRNRPGCSSLYFRNDGCNEGLTLRNGLCMEPVVLATPRASRPSPTPTTCEINREYRVDNATCECDTLRSRFELQADPNIFVCRPG